ncbi:MAG: rhodanese-like domain-containing protein [Coxiellaceae bacterium]|nr:rhodanese-like domain-containing protein [Coxiellaceae bacterium]
MTFTEKLIQFATHHWILVGGFLLLLILLFVEEARSKGLGSQISVHKAIELINREEAVIVDIRPTNAFLDGHIAKARNIPMDQLEQNISKLEAFKKKPVIVVCFRGRTALTATVMLRKAGFENAITLSGGMQAWRDASMPVKKGK